MRFPSNATLLGFFTRNPFRKDITSVVILKIVLILLLWGLFFSHHDKKALEYPRLAEHFLK
jgi:hypothetical protein